MSRSLTIIYALQSSLNFEEGGEIAENLFRLYEYARQRVLASSKSENPEDLEGIIGSLSEIRDAWRGVYRPNSDQVSKTLSATL